MNQITFRRSVGVEVIIVRIGSSVCGCGLQDRSSRARRCPHALPARQVHRILRARRRLKQGPHQLAGVVGSPRSTIYGVLRRHRMSRLAHLDRPTGAGDASASYMPQN